MNRVRINAVALLILYAIILTGCDEDERLAKMAREAADRQAEQNRQIAHQNQQLAGATKALLEADAQARTEVLTMQKNLHSQQTEIGRQRDRLEAERREIVSQRTWDSLAAKALTGLGWAIACLIPVLICWQLLRTVGNEGDDSRLTEILIEEMASPRSPLLLELGDRRALPGDPTPPRALRGPDIPEDEARSDGPSPEKFLEDAPV